MSEQCLFTSMGMFIIDEIHFPENSGKESHYNVIGGGGTYGALGSRIISGFKNSQKIGWIIDKGNDFPSEVESYLKSWETGAIWRGTPERLTTRGWNMYGDREFRDFKYLSEKKRITVDDLLKYEQLLNSESFHLICSPQRSLEILSSLNKARLSNVSNPIIIWEPVPDLCLPENLQDCLSVLKNLDVLTPNAEEAARFFGKPEPTTKEEHESIAQQFLPYLTHDSQFQTGSGIVLRAGAEGCYVLTNKGVSKWFPAYHNNANPNRSVIDPTGGGNTFIGGFTTGFVMSKGNWEIAAICGNISAGIAIEQIGMPKFDNIAGKGDFWNGKSINDRISDYVKWNGIDVDVGKVLEILI
ncbi:putative D-beta-D-heptose 7-phosphate kinase [Wickerhamomyces ciferrii]|uniref:D-beta-D-heptose 7-phosphate kinase n=1 Tax=Wickerhamomyces ciferrii (strain ATCC 14091 / BCRC 22168 / CBS 111 / JCM 3599 / NBRC 0793 / NRRL Y-1031 F-60-10) TaxID=1206466 RepID=K0KDK3_WICCF|nr:putative D-beta-D-heptose 7-phosphate kinase [Wickerhamomyces ciferrii]CCH41006.1 putative D-beta-D-heptose 7-phosphate kinase [Wickerhamomyces ciferrii]